MASLKNKKEKILSAKISDLYRSGELSTRAIYIIADKFKTIRELLNHNPTDILKFRNFGEKSLGELMDFIEEKGIELPDKWKDWKKKSSCG